MVKSLPRRPSTDAYASAAMAYQSRHSHLLGQTMGALEMHGTRKPLFIAYISWPHTHTIDPGLKARRDQIVATHLRSGEKSP